jgi:hypothetical protein
MSAEWLSALAPIASALISKLGTGQKLKEGEQIFVLLYSIAEDNRELKDEMKKLREDFGRFNNALYQLSELVNELRAETAFLKGKLNSQRR